MRNFFNYIKVFQNLIFLIIFNASLAVGRFFGKIFKQFLIKKSIYKFYVVGLSSVKNLNFFEWIIL